MVLQTADPSNLMLHRIGRPPDPLAWPPPEFRGSGRFGDPENEFGVLYASPSRLVCFLERLDTYRPDPVLRDRLEAFGADPSMLRWGFVPDDYFIKLIARFQPAPDQRWLDLRISADETAVALSREPDIACRLPGLGYGRRFKPGDVLSSNRGLTQLIARWAYDREYAGLAFSYSHRPELDCWAVFEGARFATTQPPLPIRTSDSDFVAVAKLFALTPLITGFL